MQPAIQDHYAVLGLDRNCTDAQVRAAYRVLARQHHPDLNPSSPDARRRIQAINAAYEILSEPVRRRAYDAELSPAKRPTAQTRAGKAAVSITREVHVSIQDFLRGTALEVRVNDPANTGATEIYRLVIPPETAPGTRFKIPRTEPFKHGFILVRLKARPDFRFKVRGSDLCCDLKISPQRARQGGAESVRGVAGNFLRVQIPKQAARGEIIRIAEEGLPRPRGGRGDLLVRINYRPEVHVKRA